MKKVVPTIKMIACLRNPVGRAYSHYLMRLRSGKETKSPEEAFTEDTFWVKAVSYTHLFSGIVVYLWMLGRVLETWSVLVYKSMIIK